MWNRKLTRFIATPTILASPYLLYSAINVALKMCTAAINIVKY
jgi:hypothetical protein